MLACIDRRIHIINSSEGTIKVHDIKYPNFSYEDKFQNLEAMSVTKDTLVANSDEGIVIIDKKSRQIINYQMDLEDVVLVHNCLIIWNSFGLLVYNLDEEKISHSKKYFDVIQGSQNGHKCFCSKEKYFMKRKGVIRFDVFNSGEDCIKFLMGKRGVKSNIVYVKHFGSDEYHTAVSDKKIVIAYADNFDKICKLVIHNLDNIRDVIYDINNYDLEMNSLHIDFHGERVYLFDKLRILVIDNSNVVFIRKNYYMWAYVPYYDAFLDVELNLFRVQEGKLIKYDIEYDLWNDDDLPPKISYIMDAMMDLELFPPEVYNAIYKCLCMKREPDPEPEPQLESNQDQDSDNTPHFYIMTFTV